MTQQNTLFSEASVTQRMSERQEKLIRCVLVLEEREFHGATDDELFGRAESKYPLNLPRINENEQGELIPEPQVKVDGSNFLVSYRVKVDGDGALMDWAPTSFSGGGPPAVFFSRGYLLLSYRIPDLDKDAAAVVADAKNRLDSDMQRVRQYLGWLTDDVTTERLRTRRVVLAKIAERRATVAKAVEIRRQMGL